MASRYLIGIDLGTTNCALSFIDTQARNPVSQVLPIPQFEAGGGVQESPVLPSFLYLPSEPERQAKLFDSETSTGVVGLLARDQMGNLPGRVVHSAKSWLCHAGVDREAGLLPWGSEEIPVGDRLSPVRVSARYLQYLREVWDRGKTSPDARFAAQDITLTVPASFDESAQFLTLQAAREAGFPERVRLLEEPQAAFYFWLERQRQSDGPLAVLLQSLPALSEKSQRVLVCDIGGGTTDFSLLEILKPEPRQRLPRVRRVAVSDHLLLGGDNIDLALARALEIQLCGDERRLSARQWSFLAAAARVLKEKILGMAGEPGEVFHLSIPGEGSSLLSSALSTGISRRAVEALVREGFFPAVARSDRPQQGRPGLRELGLPYAADSAVTRHLAAFLKDREIDAVLFTGGSLKPAFLRERLLQQLTQWQGRAPVVLENEEMDLAVARGAACYGNVLRRPEGKIRGGYPHSVFLELHRDDPAAVPSAVCVLPKGFEPGDKLKLSDLSFQLLVDRPVQFQLFYSNAREGDCAGQVIRLEKSEFHRLPPLQTRLDLPAGMPPPPKGLLDITVEATVSETGLLQLFCVHRPQRWRLDFNLRKTAAALTESVVETGVPEARLKAAQERLELFYGKKRVADLHESPKGLKRALEKILGQEMEDWNLMLLRALWPALSGGGHRRSPAHELTWLYLAGFCLRPGYGAELDPWRVDELWRWFSAGAAFPNQPGLMSHWWLLWRRVAGGLDAERQEQIFAKIFTPIQNRNDVLPEVILLAGALERVPLPKKVQLGETLVRQLVKHKTSTVDPHLWALGRLANRRPLYAGASAVLPPGQVETWVDRLLAVDWRGRPNSHLLFSESCRLTGERAVDVSAAVRARVVERMKSEGARAEALHRIEAIVPIDREAQSRVFGESLPAGLSLRA